MVTGWQEIGGETYYMSTRTGACATGWNLIDDVTYYFDPRFLRNGAGYDHQRLLCR